MIPFSKYAGCGNDFILIDQRQRTYPLKSQVVQTLCHRQKGIGADGVVTLNPSFQADWKMEIWNRDGSIAEMCGNAMRCLGRFLNDLGLFQKKFSIETARSVLTLEVDDSQVKVWMGLPLEILWNLTIEIENQPMTLDYIDTGVPHATCILDNVDSINLSRIGPLIRHHKAFSPRGANATIASWDGKVLKCRTFERGVEEETLACGTGAMAAAFSFAKKHPEQTKIPILTRSNEILIAELAHEPTLTGAALKIFDGQFHTSLIKIENL